MKNNRFGFTLIELLVVVLIIAVLAAIALPQFQKAVVKSRNSELKQLAKSIGEAEHMYFLEHGIYAADFEDLDMDLPLSSPGSESNGLSGRWALATRGTDSIRRGKNFEVVLNTTNLSSSLSVIALWTSGPYKCAGFSWSAGRNRLVCTKARNGTYTNTRGAFCEELEYTTTRGTNTGSWQKYY